VRFGSREWIAALVSALEAQPDLPRALDGLGRDAALVVEADPPAFPRTVAVYGEQERGRIARWRILADEDEVLELEPAYVLRAPYRLWQSLLSGGDPVQAALWGFGTPRSTRNRRCATRFSPRTSTGRPVRPSRQAS
jgi:hypothetical protein